MKTSIRNLQTSLNESILAKWLRCRSFIENRYKGGYKAALNGQSGVTMIEYVLIAAIVAGIIITLFTTFSSDIKTAWSKVTSVLKSPPA